MRTTRPYGPTAFLLECEHPVDLKAAAEGLTGVVQAVPGAATLLVECASVVDRREVERVLAELDTPTVARDPREHVLEVTYDGADLAGWPGLSPDDVVDLHTSSVLTVALIGFAPGFAYLAGLDPRLHRPRRASPRPSVPAGSVAVGGEWTGVYPRSSPGGWHLLGTTAAVLWDLAADPPARLALGDVVRFRAC